jgi:hypothetical protein
MKKESSLRLLTAEKAAVSALVLSVGRDAAM